MLKDSTEACGRSIPGESALADVGLLPKVFYRPVEAAIRWSGLELHEQQILDALNGKTIPDPHVFPQWPLLRLNTERIYDAIVNGELPWGLGGVTVHAVPDVADVRLTIRHVDLRWWLNRYYPEQRPSFLFSSTEQWKNPAITTEAVHALILERDAFRIQVDQCRRELRTLRSKRQAISTTRETTAADDEDIAPRSETTYLHIVGGLLNLLVGLAPSGKPYSSFRTQESVVDAMVAHFGRRHGISERTLHSKFAAANRLLDNH